MATVTLAEITQYRAQLLGYPEALPALDAIEECEGDLEDATMVLAIRNGLEPDTANSKWLDGLARQCRGVLCQAEYREDLLNGTIGSVVESLATAPFCPPILAAPIVIYVVKQGINQFCESFDTES